MPFSRDARARRAPQRLHIFRRTVSVAPRSNPLRRLLPPRQRYLRDGWRRRPAAPQRFTGVENFWIEGPMILKPASKARKTTRRTTTGKVTIAADPCPDDAAGTAALTGATTPSMKFVVGDLRDRRARSRRRAHPGACERCRSRSMGAFSIGKTWICGHFLPIRTGIFLFARVAKYRLSARRGAEIVAPDGRVVRDVRRQADIFGDPSRLHASQAGEDTVRCAGRVSRRTALRVSVDAAIRAAPERSSRSEGAVERRRSF